MKNNIFGTDGIRTSVGTYPLTREALIDLGYTLGSWLMKHSSKHPHILIGHDTRQSYSFIKAALKTGLLSHPLVLYDGHILPTPVVSQLVQKADIFTCGIIISASHNPYYDNGIKLVMHSGKLSDEDELTLSHLFHETINTKIMYNNLGSDVPFPQASHYYTHYLTSYFEPNFLKHISVVLDCAHGALYELAPALFEAYGAHVSVINNQPNGININQNCGSLHPELLQREVIKQKAHIGFAFDGDGDRVIAVAQDGTLLNGDAMLALLLHHTLYKEEVAVVGTSITNYGLEYFLKENNKKLLRSAVGDKYVAALLRENNLLLGGEQSGHIIMRDYLESGDGLFTALRIAQTAQHINNWSLNFFSPYPQIHVNIPVVHKKNLTEEPFASIIRTHEQQLATGRLIVRYSGTENIMRIMVEDAQENDAQHIARNLSHELQKYLTH